MKQSLIFLMLFSNAYALEVGKHYDFFQKNGQNVLGAELMAETETEYQVRIKYLPKPLVLAKANLLSQPAVSKVQPPKETERKRFLYPDFIIHASGRYNYAVFGQLNSIFQSGFEAGAGVDWLFKREPFFRVQSVSLHSGFSLYQNSPRKIQLISTEIGPKFFLWGFPKIDAALFASTLAGISFAQLTGYTFTASYATFTATGIVHFEKRIKMLVFGLNIYVNYIGDSGLSFASTGAGFSVLYPLGSAKAF